MRPEFSFLNLFVFCEYLLLNTAATTGGVVFTDTDTAAAGLGVGGSHASSDTGSLSFIASSLSLSPTRQIGLSTLPKLS